MMIQLSKEFSEEELEKMSSKELLDLLIQSNKKKLHQTPYPDDNTQ